MSAAIACGRLDEAESGRPHEARTPSGWGSPANTVRALSARAGAARGGDPRPRAQRPRSPRPIGEGLDAGYDAAIARLGAGQVLMAVGGATRRSLRSSASRRTLTRRGGASARGGRARAAPAGESDLGPGPPRPGPGEHDELTDRERDIADLVATGQSNKQVAAALFLSEKTIEHNLSRIYAKLGVRSRHELTRVLHSGP